MFEAIKGSGLFLKEGRPDFRHEYLEIWGID